jgi:hypothetical protein
MTLPRAPIAHQGFFAAHFFTWLVQQPQLISRTARTKIQPIPSSNCSKPMLLLS